MGEEQLGCNECIVGIWSKVAEHQISLVGLQSDDRNTYEYAVLMVTIEDPEDKEYTK